MPPRSRGSPQRRGRARTELAAFAFSDELGDNARRRLLYKGGQMLFDLVELEDLMLDGAPPPIVATTLDAPALARMAKFIRTLRRHLDGSIRTLDVAAIVSAPPGRDDSDLPPIEAGFYLYEDVVLGILVSARPLLASGAGSEDDRGPDEPASVTDEPGTPDIVITHVEFKGKVPRTQADEYVEISNRGSAPADISGWLLNAGDRGQDFTFPDAVVLEPGQAIRVYTNEIHPETGGFSYASKRAVWNDKGDIAYLRDAGGVLISHHAYGNAQQP